MHSLYLPPTFHLPPSCFSLVLVSCPSFLPTHYLPYSPSLHLALPYYSFPHQSPLSAGPNIIDGVDLNGWDYWWIQVSVGRMGGRRGGRLRGKRKLYFSSSSRKGRGAREPEKHYRQKDGVKKEGFMCIFVDIRITISLYSSVVIVVFLFLSAISIRMRVISFFPSVGFFCPSVTLWFLCDDFPKYHLFPTKWCRHLHYRRMAEFGKQCGRCIFTNDVTESWLVDWLLCDYCPYCHQILTKYCIHSAL